MKGWPGSNLPPSGGLAEKAEAANSKHTSKHCFLDAVQQASELATLKE